MTLVEFLKRLTPYQCRILARTGRTNAQRPKSTLQIARETGFSVRKVIRISNLTDWSKVFPEDVDRFTAACGVSHFNRKQVTKMLKRIGMKYIDNATSEQRRMLSRLSDLNKKAA